MEVAEVRRRVDEAVGGEDDEDVFVQVEQTAVSPLHVTISSKHPATYYTQWVDLRADGTVHLPAPDDGFTSPGAKGTDAGTATSTEEAVALVVREAAKAVAYLREMQARHAASARPAVQPPVADDALAEACRLWQGGRDVGSSPVRGAGRVLTGVNHYFFAPFIAAYNQQARTTPEVLDAGIALLRSVNAAPFRDADGWSSTVGLAAGGFAGRGIKSKTDEDPQIERQLRRGQIEMPLWGVSLSPAVAAGFGTRFLFELVGEFPAVPAWVHSGIKAEEQELVTGGRYRLLSQDERDGTTHVRLRWMGASGDEVGSDELLMTVLGAVPGVVRSSLKRSVGREVLELRLGGEDWATVTRAAGGGTVQVTRYWPPDPDWARRGDDPYAQAAAIDAASRTTTVPADVAAIVAAVMRGKETA
ncbi:hypothetical protein [Blastococcus sp. URHD0036]|uniref:hypothetical protein n=1 Tax=Blastococcus sp. URHD0036 TaxID=1380356 RepID=UPI0012DE4D6C|nr:hypothetical protein [Blastococcus sp. URHD0036]